jgi:hypothetical protein
VSVEISKDTAKNKTILTFKTFYSIKILRILFDAIFNFVILDLLFICFSPDDDSYESKTRESLHFS